MLPTRQTPRVAVSLKAGPTYTADILRGIVEYSNQAGHWRLEVDSYYHFGQRPARIDEHWQGDGIILLGGENRLVKMSRQRRRGIAVVNATGWREAYPNAPFVFWNDAEIARLAARHLLELGLRRFAYFGPRYFAPSRQRAAAFLNCVREHGGTAQSCEWTAEEVCEVTIWSEKSWEQAARFVEQKLRQLDPPAGIFANNDLAAALIIQVAASLGLNCPKDIAVLGIWNDKVVCESTQPNISSIEMDFFALGYKAAEFLDKMLLNGSDAVPRNVVIGPKRLVNRASTEFLDFDDELIARALRIIRETAPRKPLTVEDLLKSLPMSPSSFRERFRKAVGRSAKAEILRTRIEHARTLLQTTSWTITRIAEEMGFESSHELARLFRARTGLTPSEFRSKSAP